MTLSDLGVDDLNALHAQQRKAYDALHGRGLKLDLTRGKPAPEQLDLSAPMLDLPGKGNHTSVAGTDCRNYGGLAGLPELRAIFAELLGVPAEQLLAGDNASLGMMHDTIVFALLKGTADSARPWSAEPTVKFCCPVPGYDRHFALCEQYGIEMIPVPMRADGPDVDAVRAVVAGDPAVKGMWLVPTYSNPTGAVVTDEVAQALASMPAAAADFRLFWDNAYAVHHLTDTQTRTPDILSLSAAAGNPNRPFVFASTSKITFAGAGVCFFGSSAANVAWYQQHLSKATIGPDKLNQLRHARFLGSADGVRALMREHRALIAPKFQAVIRILRDRLGPYEVASWTEPAGGYFVSLDVPDGTAARVVALAGEAGIAMTPAGSAFPYHDDPRDRNIRIAPTFPALADVEAAMDGLATCVLLAATEKLLGAESRR